MEKFLKSINDCISLKKINLNSYSSSEGWIGYYEAKDVQDYKLISTATELVTLYFGEELKEFFLISALAESNSISPLDSEIKEIDKIYGTLFKLAREKKFIQDYSLEFNNYLEREDDLPAKLLNFHFEVSYFMPFCEVLMAYYFSKIAGQFCFLINPKLQIALYPHDDTGFGCISFDGNSKVLIDFLEFCNTHPNFSSTFNKKVKTLVVL